MVRKGLIVGSVGVGLVVLLSSPVFGSINLEVRPSTQTVQVGATVNLGLFAVSDSSANQLMSAADVIIGWDAGFLDLLGNDNTGAVSLLVSGFPSPGPYNLNEVIPPQDGDGFYLAYASLGHPVAATPTGTLLTTFKFTALAETVLTEMNILPTGGSPAGPTVVYDGTVPNTDVTGTLGTAGLTIVPEPAFLSWLALGGLGLRRRRGGR